MPAAGFVLVGGRSRRFGRNKALFEWQGQPLAVHAARRLAPWTSEVALVGDPQLYGHLGYRCIHDLRPGLGPLAGLEAALSARLAPWSLVLACDLPLVSDSTLGRLRAATDTTERPCIAVRGSDGKAQPLCAAYSAACLPAISAALDRGEFRMNGILEQLDASYLDVDEVLANVNRPEDWEQVLAAACGMADHG